MKIMINKDEILFKIDAVIKYLKEHNGYDYKLYNRLCPGYGDPDSDIVEYAEDIESMIEEIFKKLESDITL